MAWIFSGLKSLFTGKTSNDNTTNVPLKTATKATHIDADEAARKAICASNKKRMKLERELYGNAKSNPPVLSMERRIRNALAAKNRDYASKLSIRKMQCELQLSRLEGQKSNLIKNKGVREEMEINKNMAIALKANNDAVKAEIKGLDVSDLEDIVDQTHFLQTDVASIGDALAFQGTPTIYDIEGEEYLDELEREMEEEDAMNLLKGFAEVPNSENNDNNNNNNVVADEYRSRPKQNRNWEHN